MKLQLSHLVTFAATLALTSAAPSLVVETQEGPNSHSQKQLHGLDGDIHALCQPKDALCMETPFLIRCCDGLSCTDDSGGKCAPTDSAKNHLSAGAPPNEEVNPLDGDVHAMCRFPGEFCQLVPLALACCGSYRCSSIFGGHCEPF